jgi:hypothetical protein
MPSSGVSKDFPKQPKRWHVVRSILVISSGDTVLDRWRWSCTRISLQPTDRLAALIVEDFREPLDHHYWMAKFPASDKVWLGEDNGNFHPEKFHYLFTIIDAPTDANSDGSQVRFAGIERETSDGVDLILYRPVGNQLKPVVANHHFLQQLITQM